MYIIALANNSAYLTCNTRANTPAANGAAADVPEKEFVQPLLLFLVLIASQVVW